MTNIKKSKKKSKKVLGRKPNSTFYIRETISVDDGNGKKHKEYILHAVDDFTSRGNFNYKT
jgi:hypothetical protein